MKKRNIVIAFMILLLAIAFIGFGLKFSSKSFITKPKDIHFEELEYPSVRTVITVKNVKATENFDYINVSSALATTHKADGFEIQKMSLSTTHEDASTSMSFIIKNQSKKSSEKGIIRLTFLFSDGETVDYDFLLNEALKSGQEKEYKFLIKNVIIDADDYKFKRIEKQ